MSPGECGVGGECKGLRAKLARDTVVGMAWSELYSSLSPAHHPWQLWPDPAAPFPHLLPGPGTNLYGGQTGEPEPEEGGDQRGEGRAAAFRYQPLGCQGASWVVLRKPVGGGGGGGRARTLQSPDLASGVGRALEPEVMRELPREALCQRT